MKQKARRSRYLVASIRLSAYLARPGATLDIDSITLPTHGILGDTLTAGSYRVGATPNDSASQAGETNAGVIELAAL